MTSNCPQGVSTHPIEEDAFDPRIRGLPGQVFVQVSASKGDKGFVNQKVFPTTLNQSSALRLLRPTLVVEKQCKMIRHYFTEQVTSSFCDAVVVVDDVTTEY